MLRRKKTDTLDGKPLIILPPRNVQVVTCDFDEDERAFYDALKDRTDATLRKIAKEGEASKNYTAVLLLLLRLRQGMSISLTYSRTFELETAQTSCLRSACCHPGLISKDFMADKDAIDSRPAVTNDDDEKDEADDLADLFGKLGVSKKVAHCSICQTA
jgi:SNF2 family DNA or RNA helicase